MRGEKDITVIGGGIGGMAAALALALRGAQVRVLEQAPALREVGAGLQISPNGMAVLGALGVDGALIAKSVRGQGVILKDGLRGTPVLRLNLRKLPSRHPWLMVHRADLLECLADGARAAGVSVETGAMVCDVAPAKTGVTITLADGTQRSAAVVIGADGIRSATRAAVSAKDKTRFTGQVAWRALVRTDAARVAEAHVHMGPGRHLVTYPLRDGKLVNIVAVQEREAWAEEGWSQPDDPAALRAAFADFAPDVRQLLEGVEDVHLWGLHRHPVARRWHKDRLILMGDAVHPTLPFLAQGACMALEDAWVLAALLARHRKPAAAARMYQLTRRPRCVQIVRAANGNARAYHLHSPWRQVAHLMLRMAGRASADAPLRRFDWLYGHDVTREVP